jgi:hypothetical protein
MAVTNLLNQLVEQIYSPEQFNISDALDREKCKVYILNSAYSFLMGFTKDQLLQHADDIPTLRKTDTKGTIVDAIHKYISVRIASETGLVGEMKTLPAVTCDRAALAAAVGPCDKNLSEFISSQRSTKDMDANNPMCQNILSSVENTKEYLRRVIRLESEILLLDKYWVLLEENKARQRYILNQKKQMLKAESSDLAFFDSYPVLTEIKMLEVLLKRFPYFPFAKKEEILLALGVDAPTKPADREMPTPPRKPASAPVEPIKPQAPDLIVLQTLPQKPTAPQYQTPGFLNKRRVQAENETLRIQYELAVRKYEFAFNTYNTNKAANEAALAKYEIDLAAYNEAYAEYVQKKEKNDILQEKYQIKLQAYRQALQTYEAQTDAYDASVKEYHVAVDALCLAKLKDLIEAKKLEIAPAKKLAAAKATELLDHAPEHDYIKFLTSEQELAKKEIKKILATLNRVYSLNVIYSKYRSYVPLNTFCEYLESGRCDSLAGPAGAYNLFEAESRSNEILSQLSSISASLETIKNTQFMIYQELKSINSSLSDITNTLDDMAGTLNNIAFTSCVTAGCSLISAHYSRINAAINLAQLLLK